MRGLVLSLLLIALIPATAQASRMPLPAHITVHNAACPAFAVERTQAQSCASLDTDEIYLAPGADKFAKFHEIGHLFDDEVLTPSDRSRLADWFGGGDWWGEQGEATPGEMFGDAYAACALGRSPVRGVWDDVYGYRPSARKHRRVCTYIKTVGLLRPLQHP